MGTLKISNMYEIGVQEAMERKNIWRDTGQGFQDG